LPHTIRHTVSTNMALNGAPLLIIQLYLGHSDRKTTLRYIRRADDVATRAYRYKHGLKTTAGLRRPF
jgi:integrase/recombinase XerD